MSEVNSFGKKITFFRAESFYQTKLQFTIQIKRLLIAMFYYELKENVDRYHLVIIELFFNI